ncbi:MAG: hypothetical protein HY807_01365 [Nitrospirae bacterium]|nr:hypothetical protein [Nitrospirota bacterium]
MMEESKPTMEEWRALYEAAVEFRKLAPWEWVKETSIFGVQNPMTGEIGYCCIMGELGEGLAMAVYQGTEGLNVYKKILKNQVDPGEPDAMFIQDCLIVIFENKRLVEKKDLELIGKLGYIFRGKNAWPVFKSYQPGFYPWFLNRDEASYMTLALQQAKDVCLRLKENNKLLHDTKKNLHLVRVSEIKDDNVIWKDEWREPLALKKIDYSSYPVDELWIQRIKNSIKQVSAVWEIDSFYAPTPIKEEGRPYLPYAIMLADHDTGFVYDVYLSPLDKYKKDFIERFLSYIENESVIPIEILVRKEEIVRLFEPYTGKLNIKLSEVKRLQSIDNARRSMAKFFSS